jgi:hypothetical protein
MQKYTKKQLRRLAISMRAKAMKLYLNGDRSHMSMKDYHTISQIARKILNKMS